MRISSEFATGETTEVEVADAIGAVVIDSRRTEDSAERKPWSTVNDIAKKVRKLVQEYYKMSK